jgi:hypothetical protein
MVKRDREGWQDDRSGNDFSQWRIDNRSSSNRVVAASNGERRTAPWDGPGFELRPGKPDTAFPESLQELYGILVVLTGPRRFDIYKIAQRRVVIGRELTDITLDDQAVSKQHAIIAVLGNDYSDAEFRLLDGGIDRLPSKAGTVVNGKHISETILHDRDKIRLGETTLLFVQLWPEAR